MAAAVVRARMSLRAALAGVIAGKLSTALRRAIREKPPRPAWAMPAAMTAKRETKPTKATKASGGGAFPSAEQVRAWWGARQHMGGAMKGASPAQVLARTGWARSVGGCNPYLTLRDRA